MSGSNGHLPEGAVVATLEMLRAVNTTIIRAANASRRAGVPVFVRIRPIRKSRYLAMLAPRPAEADAWGNDPEEYGKHYAVWIASLSEEARAARRAADDAVTFKVLQEGVFEPAYSAEVGVLLADDVDDIAVEILRFSDILPPAPKKPEAKPEAAVVVDVAPEGVV